MHNNFPAKLLIVTLLIMDQYRTPGMGIYALDDMHSPFLDTKISQDTRASSGQMISQDRQNKVEQFLGRDGLPFSYNW